MREGLALAAVVALLAACAPGARAPVAPPVRTADFKSSEIRQPVVLVSFTLGPGQWGDTERRTMPEDYEGALLEGLNARAVLAREVRVSVGGRDATLETALARARELGADHAIFVEVQLVRGVLPFCRENRRTAFTAEATVWGQRAEVARTSDAALRLRMVPGPTSAVPDLDADCEKPRESRRRSPAEAAAESVNKLLTGLLDP